MHSVRGRIIGVQEGRFRLVADDGRVMPFVLSHKAAAEPQDLPPLMAKAVRVRVSYSESRHLIADVAQRLEIIGGEIEE
jgi:hypothetical protein